MPRCGISVKLYFKNMIVLKGEVPQRIFAFNLAPSPSHPTGNRDDART